MKKTILLLRFIFISCIVCAQTPPVLRTLPARIKYTDTSFEDESGDYYKDLNNELDKYVGNWVYNNGSGKILTLNIRKQEMFYSSASVGGQYYFTDDIIVTYKLEINNEILVDNLNLPLINTFSGLPNEIALKYGSYTLDKEDNSLKGSITDLPLNILTHSEIYYLPQTTGNPKIKLSNFGSNSWRGNPREFYIGKPTFILPNNVELTKI